MLFRHSVGVNMLYHGSSVSTYLKIEKDGRKWVCIRPNRQVNKLDFDAKRIGFENVPSVLFGRKKAICELGDDQLIWYSDFINDSELFFHTIYDLNWFIRKVLEREKAYEICKDTINKIYDICEKETITKEEYIDTIHIWRDSYSTVFPYAFLALMTDELIVESYTHFLKHLVDSEKVSAILNQTFKSEYAKNAIEFGYIPKLSKALVFPPEQKFIPEGYINFKNNMEYDKEIIDAIVKKETDQDLIGLYFRYKIVVPIIFQLSDENFYVLRGLSIAVNHLLDKLGEKLINKNLIKEKEDILNMDVNELIYIVEMLVEE